MKIKLKYVLVEKQRENKLNALEIFLSTGPNFPENFPRCSIETFLNLFFPDMKK